MVAVAHGQRQRVAAGGIRILFVKLFLTAQHGQCILDLRDEGRVFHSPARNVAAVQHQFALVYLGQLLFVRRHRLDEGAARVIGQHHDVRRFQTGAGAHLHAGRDAAFHGALAGAHRAFLAPAVAVGFQLGALYVDKAVHRAGEHILCVIVHGGVDLFNAGVRIAVLQIDLRQDQVQGAGTARCCGLGLLPVIPVTGELVAGDAAPLFQRDLCRRQKDMVRCKAGFGIHSRFLPLIKPETLLENVGAVQHQMLHALSGGRLLQCGAAVGVHRLV